MSLYQAVVLLGFNDKDTISYEEIKATTGIEKDELERTLQSLACGKVRPLSKSPKSREVNANDMFTYDANFTHVLHRIVVNSIQAKETVQEQQETNQRVFEDRQYQVDAAIVRIMKQNKTIEHRILVSSLFETLKFPIQVKEAKAAIRFEKKN